MASTAVTAWRYQSREGKVTSCLFITKQIYHVGSLQVLSCRLILFTRLLALKLHQQIVFWRSSLKLMWSSAAAENFGELASRWRQGLIRSRGEPAKLEVRLQKVNKMKKWYEQVAQLGLLAATTKISRAHQDCDKNVSQNFSPQKHCLVVTKPICRCLVRRVNFCLVIPHIFSERCEQELPGGKLIIGKELTGLRISGRS